MKIAVMMNLSVLLLLALPVLSSASLRDIENTTNWRNDSSGILPTTANNPMLTDLPILSTAKLRQKRQVQSLSFVPEQGSLLEWVTWNNSLPNDAISIYNGYVDRSDYICKYKCEAGFYTPSKGPYCYYPSKKMENQGSPFEILVNKDSFEILEWKDDSYGSVPENSVWTCPGEKTYVGQNKYGLGKVSTQDKAFYLPYKGEEYQYNYYLVLTTNKNIISQQIYNIRYNTDDSEISHYPPEVMRKSTISNYECQPVAKKDSLSKTYQVEQRWGFSFSILFGGRTTITTGIPLIVEGQIEFSAEVTLQFTKENTVVEIIADTVSVELISPPNHSCIINMVRYKYKVNIPFTALLRRTYGNGEVYITSITGTYDSIQVGEVQAVVNRCGILDESKPCP